MLECVNAGSALLESCTITWELEVITCGMYGVPRARRFLQLIPKNDTF